MSAEPLQSPSSLENWIPAVAGTVGGWGNVVRDLGLGPQSRSSSLMDVLLRVRSSTVFMITAQ